MRNDIVLIFSGGLDSSTLLYYLRSGGFPVRALSINYGQRHQRELHAAEVIARRAGVEHKIADLTALRPLMAGSSQTSDDIAVPEGHYAEETMRQTVVPNRNSLMLAVAVAWAQSIEARTVAYAAHSGDHFIYWDCRPDFIRALRGVYALAEPYPVALRAPFEAWNKAAIARAAHDLGVPIAETYSCYKNGPVQCGRCGTCYERREAFTMAGVHDPTPYLDTTVVFKEPL